MYAGDPDGVFPDKLLRLYPDYISALMIFECPCTGDRVRSPDRIQEDGSYVYVGGLGQSDEKLIAYDKPGNHRLRGRGRNQLYVDGHVDWRPAP